MEKPSVLQAKLIEASKENEKLRRILDVVHLRIEDLEKRVSKLEK